MIVNSYVMDVYTITIARKFSIGELYVCSGGLDILKFDKNSTDL